MRKRQLGLSSVEGGDVSLQITKSHCGTGSDPSTDQPCAGIAEVIRMPLALAFSRTGRTRRLIYALGNTHGVRIPLTESHLPGHGQQTASEKYPGSRVSVFASEPRLSASVNGLCAVRCIIESTTRREATRCKLQ